MTLRLTSPRAALHLKERLESAEQQRGHVASADSADRLSPDSGVMQHEPRLKQHLPSQPPLHQSAHPSSTASTQPPTRSTSPQPQLNVSSARLMVPEHLHLKDWTAPAASSSANAPAAAAVDVAADGDADQGASEVDLSVSLLEHRPAVMPSTSNRAMQLTGMFVFASSLGLEIYWLYLWFTRRPFDAFFPLYLVAAVVILFYSTFVLTVVCNSLLNLVLPLKWIQQNSAYYSATPSVLPWAAGLRRKQPVAAAAAAGVALSRSNTGQRGAASSQNRASSGQQQQQPQQQQQQSATVNNVDAGRHSRSSSPPPMFHDDPLPLQQEVQLQPRQLSSARLSSGSSAMPRSRSNSALSAPASAAGAASSVQSPLPPASLLLLSPPPPVQQQQPQQSLPRVVLQMPVYTEDFTLTIRPSIENALQAGRCYVNTYRTASFGFMLNDDGLVTLSDEKRRERVEFYEQQSELCYIARAKEGRAGRFKKASNLNFGLCWLKRALVHSQAHGVSLDRSLKLLGAEHGFLAGAGAQFSAETTLQEPLGRYMLLLDSDSRMGEESIFPLVTEMELDPTLGFLQVCTRPMLVVGDYFEKLIGLFTERIFFIAFVYSCSNGMTAPLVGHNVLLRCEAMERVAWYDEQGRHLHWAEDKVSEDFDLSLRLASGGYFGRYIGYDLGFQEGVSLHVLEEISRWSKYTFGVNEMMFQPVRTWRSKGIVSSTLTHFALSSEIAWFTKFGAISYMGSYYAMAAGPIIALMNYFLLAYSPYWQVVVDQSSVDIFFTCVIIFGLLLPISNLVVVWRLSLSPHGFARTIKTEIAYSFFMSMLFTGLSYHILSALLHHTFSIPISWSTTTKEGQLETSRWKEIKHTLSHLRIMYMWGAVMLLMMACMYSLPPEKWQVRRYAAVLPLLYLVVSHMLCPFLLNPIIMLGAKKQAQQPQPSLTGAAAAAAGVMA